MPSYKYIGKTPDGNKIEGLIDGVDKYDALSRAQVMCPIVSSIEEVKEKKGILSKELKRGISSSDISIMCQQFSTVLSSGINIVKCVNLVADQTLDKSLKEILNKSVEKIMSGQGLADSMEEVGGEQLPTVFYETIRAGEDSGTLKQSFDKMHDYFAKKSKVRAKLISTLTYPAFVVLLAIVVVAIMMVFVIPTFEDILRNYGAELPLMTKILIDVSNFFKDNIILIVAILAALIIGVKIWAKTSKGKLKWARMKLSLPVLGKISRFTNAAQFSNTMALLMSSGIRMTEALQISSRVVGNYAFSTDIKGLIKDVETGHRIGYSLESIDYMPKTLCEMITVGEETGSIESTFQTMGEFYDNETERTIEKAISRLEPAILVFIAVFAGYVVLALYIAMFSIYGSM